MKRLMTIVTLLSLAAPFAAASDLRHLRFASTPTEAAVAGPSDRPGQAPYALTGRKAEAKVIAPSAPARNTWVVGNPNFRPGK